MHTITTSCFYMCNLSPSFDNTVERTYVYGGQNEMSVSEEQEKTSIYIYEYI